MAKKQITNYKFFPGNSTPTTSLYPNALSLIEANKKFIAEEAVAYIQYNVTHNVPPFVGYVYSQTKCRRDIAYVIEAYINDLRHGSNQQTLFVANLTLEKD